VVASALIVVPLDPKLGIDDWSTQLNHAEAVMIFCSSSFLEAAKKIKKKAPSVFKILCWSGSQDDETETYSEIMKKMNSPSPLPPVMANSNDVATLIYTSGTTGGAKGVLLTHSSLMLNSKRIARKCDSPGKIRSLLLPLHHVYGFIVALGTLFCGQSLILYPQFDLKVIAKGFKILRPQYVSSVPSLFNYFAKQIKKRLSKGMASYTYLTLEFFSRRWGGPRASRMKNFKKLLFAKVHQLFGNRVEYFNSGGAPLETWVRELFHLIGIPILEGYGLTETSAIITAEDLSSYKIGSVGKRPIDLGLKIDKPDTNGVGEIVVRGETLMKGYYKNPEATRKVIDEAGWFHTGDLGYFDSDDFLFITGRKKELIVTANGKKVFPEELELFFKNNPFIKEVCVFGIPASNQSKAEIVHLQVVPNMKRLKEHQIIDVEPFVKNDLQHHAQLLPEYKRPQSLGISFSEFPKTSTYKIKKNEVKSQYLDRSAFGISSGPRPTDPLLETPMGKIVLKILKSLVPDEIWILSIHNLNLDLGFDSLRTMEFWSTLEETLNTKIPDEKKVAQSVKDILGTLNSMPVVGSLPENRLPHSGSPTYWKTLLETRSEEIQNGISTILKSHKIARPLFLKFFQRFFRRFSRLKIQGVERIPKTYPFILAPNHESYLDNLFLVSQLPSKLQKKVIVIGAKEFFDHRLTRIIAKWCHAIPIERGNVSSTVLQMGAEVLRRKKILLVHPEGTRSPNGELLPLRPGVGLLASALGCPVVPIYIEGAHEFWPKNSKLPKKRSRITVTIGHPIFPQSPGETSPILLSGREVTDRLQKSFLDLKEGRENTSWVTSSSSSIAVLPPKKSAEENSHTERSSKSPEREKALFH
jgi:long-chain acyl-CoA synthetase